MPIVQAIAAISASLPMASRAFVPLFVVSLLSNPTFHSYCPSFLQQICLHPPANLAWMGNEWFLLGVGVLALIECAADKNDDLQELLQGAQVVIKSAVAILVSLAILPPNVQSITNTLPQETAGIATLGMGLIAVLTAFSTFYLARKRQKVYDQWYEIDDGDDFGLRTIISCFEDLWAFIAIPLLIVLPVLTIALVIVLLIFIAIMQRILEHLENRERTPCPACDTMALPTATTCSKCHGALQPARLLTWNMVFNRNDPEPPSPVPEDDKRQHMLRLLASRRCPACAERISLTEFLEEGCPACGFNLDDSAAEEWFDQYRQAVIGRTLRLLVPALLISWIPVVGMAFAIVSIRILLVVPFRIFLGRLSRVGLKWSMRLFTLLLFLPGSLPILSILAVPIFIVVHILVYGHFAKRAIAARVGSNQ